MNRALLLVVGTGALALAGTLAGDGPRKETPTARTGDGGADLGRAVAQVGTVARRQLWRVGAGAELVAVEAAVGAQGDRNEVGDSVRDARRCDRKGPRQALVVARNDCVPGEGEGIRNVEEASGVKRELAVGDGGDRRRRRRRRRGARFLCLACHVPTSDAAAPRTSRLPGP